MSKVARQTDMFVKPKRKMRGQLMHVCDVSCDGPATVQMRCSKCGYKSWWIVFETVTEAKRGLPCPRCAGDQS